MLGPSGILTIADFDGGAFHRTGEITLDHLQSVLRRVSDTDVTLNAIHQATSWTDRAMQTTTYRSGRVLVAGDAAHIHSPLGGQGLNTGLGDAMNLGWKLAATIRGTAPEGLLDTYTAERHPVGARVLDWSRAQVDIMRPSLNARAMESVVHDLMDTSDGSTYFAERVWGVSLRYDLGASHPLVGRSTPDFVFQSGATVGSLMKEGTGLLLEFGSHSTLESLARGWSNRVKHVLHLPEERLGLNAPLVRPDGVVAWASDEESLESDVEAALTRWFGVPN
jgi:FAD binding domain